MTVIIPARNEIYLENTIRDLLKNVRGNTEISVVLDGWTPDPVITVDDERVTFHHFPESIGQRAAINWAADKSTAKFIMKLDAHCAVDEGFDVKLMADCEPDWTVIPRMYNLDVKTWLPKLHKRTDYMYIGLRDNGELRAEYYTDHEYRVQHRKEALIDDVMCCMGPGFFMHRQFFLDTGGCDDAGHGGWGQQGIEVACKAWLSGGRMVVNKKTWFAHWFRGDIGFPYPLSGRAVAAARKHSKDLWVNNKWPNAVRPFQFLLDKFNPPGWETKMDKAQAEEQDTTYRAFRHAFGSRVQGDNMPIGCRTGDRETLCDVLGKLNFKAGVEIGVKKGSFSHQILQRSNIHLTCVDPWMAYGGITQETQDRNFGLTQERLKSYAEVGRLNILRKTSMDAVNEFADGSLDFVYIDGNHSFEHAVMDIIHWHKKLRPGGIMAVHDYCAMRQGGVIEAVNSFTHCNRITPWFVTREVLPTAFWVKP